ncbi:MAG: hypothetical protein COB15_05730 [Flavobacteriales bacterium]|nr:MAG: hypothetical protein COB15_05730 [Flavobacteriales bacterium]
MVFKEINRVLGFVLVILISVSTYSQTATAIFKSDYPFQITINHIKQQNNYSKSSIIYKLSGNRPYNIKINFENDTAFIQKNIYIIDDGLAHIFNVSKKAIQLKKVIPSASYVKPENQLAIVYLENTSLPTEPIKTDTTQIKDTAYVVPFDSYYKLEDYTGRIGCPFPIKPNKQTELKGLILAENLEESKLEKVKLALLDLDSACILVDQIKELVLLFEYEETRLDFSKFMIPYTFDIDNYEKLYSVFNFDNSKDELKELFGKKD